MGLSYSRAAGLIEKTLAVAAKESAKVAVVVVDAGGHILAAARMDDVGYFNVDAAAGKARACVNIGAPTHAIAHLAEQDRLIGAALSATLAFVILPGGFPITDGDRTVGGIGVAGGHYAQDLAIIEAVLR